MGLITLSDLKTFLTITSTENDEALNAFINHASAAVESYCGRIFTSGSVTEIHDGGTTSIFVDRLPINNVALVAEYDGTQYLPLIGSSVASGELANTNISANSVATFVWNSSTGEISRDTSIGSGLRNLDFQQPIVFSNYANGVKVIYNGGFDTIPKDIQLATANYVKMLYKQDQATLSASLLGESKQQFGLSGNFPPHIRRILDLYRIW